MAQVAVPETLEAAPARPTTRRGSGTGDAVFAFLCRASAALVLVLLGAIIVELFIGGLPAFRAFGAAFVSSTEWDPVQEIYGAGVPIYGTILTAILALLLAVPVAFGIAFFLTELAPEWMRGPVGTAIELLAAVPSIIFGMWGFFVIVPVMAGTIQPAIIDTIGELPLVGSLFQGPPFGTGLFTAALILAIMVLPFIAATMRDVFLQVPGVYKESAYGLGSTRWEVMRKVVLPYTRVSVVGGIMLGLGRALGETMAVTFVIGNANRITPSLFGPGNTIASIVALEFGESGAGSLKLSALLALGFLLFVISFAVLALSRWLLRSRLKG
ncbi:phosphate ABC transporter permease subunit PstC [Roseomonas populi]|uniref:Phosphate transport system permease protein n=1 Tax=Roseomonas populi TaxID=3121582 RepID=A0ABT1X9E4_9PROT|nr:phosphate ABC transporter permease subunit PstC [Roseomonas pecuniae]MCR0984324.1 phosphate ABC transporter permease subunit PstC [Roseomonas pecuniae]